MKKYSCIQHFYLKMHSSTSIWSISTDCEEVQSLVWLPGETLYVMIFTFSHKLKKEKEMREINIVS